LNPELMVCVDTAPESTSSWARIRSGVRWGVPCPRKPSGLLVAVLAAAGACTVGPDHESPARPQTERYTPVSQPSGPHAPVLDQDVAIPNDWWTVFGSPPVAELVGRALVQSPTLAAARARLTQAQELFAARTGTAWLPQVDATAGAVRQHIDPAVVGFPQAPNPGVFNVFSLGAEASYVFDVFGGVRRELEALDAGVEFETFELEAARLTLASNVVVAAIRMAALDARLDALEEGLAARRRQLEISEGRLAAGGVAAVDVRNERSRVLQAEAALPPLRAQRAHTAHLLAVLTGEPPGTANVPAIRLSDLQLPATLPLRLPAELVRRRPDIRAGEALLHRACADVGVATAALYPSLSLSGSISSSRLEANDVFGNGINLWNFGANLLAPVFRGGELRARERAAVAAFEQAGAAYRESVLQALQNVADVLRSLEHDGHTHALLSEAAQQAEDAYRVASACLELGGVSEYAMLDAERRRQEARSERLQSVADRCVDVVALYQALGGGGIGDQEPTGSR